MSELPKSSRDFRIDNEGLMQAIVIPSLDKYSAYKYQSFRTRLDILLITFRHPSKEYIQAYRRNFDLFLQSKQD